MSCMQRMCGPTTASRGQHDLLGVESNCQLARSPTSFSLSSRGSREFSFNAPNMKMPESAQRMLATFGRRVLRLKEPLLLVVYFSSCRPRATGSSTGLDSQTHKKECSVHPTEGRYCDIRSMFECAEYNNKSCTLKTERPSESRRISARDRTLPLRTVKRASDASLYVICCNNSPKHVRLAQALLLKQPVANMVACTCATSPGVRLPSMERPEQRPL